MHIDGVACGIFLPQAGLDFAALSERAQVAEQSGFHSLWLADHMWARGMPDLDYLECWTALTALALRTTRLRLGTLVLCNSYRNPALVAKMASTFDHISGGRLELGIGAGWMDEEHASLAKAFCTMRMRETVGWARELMGGNGILLDHDVGRFVADAEAIYSYEGTREINALVVGRAITGLSAFV